MFYKLFIKHLFRDINARQIVYFLYPILYGITVLSLACNSWLFFGIISISFFFSMDAVLIQSKNRILDISKFYAIPKSISLVLFEYYSYRIKISFLFSYLPALLIGATFLSGMAPLELMSGVNGYFHYFLSCTLSWILYILMSTPLLPAGFRSKSVIEVFKAPGYLFYLGFLITQMAKLNVPIPFSTILVVYTIMLIGIVCLGYYYVVKLMSQDKIFPE